MPCIAWNFNHLNKDSMPQNLANKISNFVSHATPETPANPPPQAPQSIHSNVNIGSIVAGGNVTTVYRGGAPIAPSNQNMTACPVCGTPMSITANACMACGDDLANRRLVALHKARQRRVTRLIALNSIPYLAVGGAVGAVLVAFITSVQY